jgi:prepilin-type N-terminal cleavage/methylation domain-containing protein
MDRALIARPAAGFTLVELLVASAMAAVLCVGLGAHLRGGVEVWRRASAVGETVQRQRVALERLERDLSNATFYDTRAESYGDPDGQLASPSFGNRALAWFTIQPAAAGKAVRLVSYWCGTVDNTIGLWRASQSVGEARAHQPVMPQLLLPGCDRLTLQYAIKSADSTDMQWLDEWPDPISSLPRLVSVVLRLESGQEVGRVFAVPAGSLALTPAAST